MLHLPERRLKVADGHMRKCDDVDVVTLGDVDDRRAAEVLLEDHRQLPDRHREANDERDDPKTVKGHVGAAEGARNSVN